MSGARYLHRPCCVLQQRHFYSPKITGNTQESVAPFHDWKIYLDVKPWNWYLAFCYTVCPLFYRCWNQLVWFRAQSLIDKYLWKRWAKFRKLSYICSCKQRSLPNTFDNISHYRHGKCDKSSLVCCHLCKMFAWEIFIVVSFVWTKQQKKTYFNKYCLTQFLYHFSLLCVDAKNFAIVSVTIGLCQKKKLSVRTCPYKPKI